MGRGRKSQKGTENETVQMQARYLKTEAKEVISKNHYGHNNMSDFLRWCWDIGREKAEKEGSKK